VASFGDEDELSIHVLGGIIELIKIYLPQSVFVQQWFASD